MTKRRLTEGGTDMSEKTKQTEKVLEYIKQHGSIDQWRAMRDLRIMRLGARIWDLKAQGVPIKTVGISKLNEAGEHVHWAEYSLAAEDAAS